MAGKHTIIKKAICIFTALLTAAMITMPNALAFDEKDNKAQQSQLQKENEKKQNELAKTEQTLQEKIKYSENLQQKISDLSKKIKQSNDTIKTLNKKIKENQVLVEEKNAQIDSKLDVLKQRLRAIYTAGDISSLEIVLQAKTFSDYVDKMELVSCITASDNKLIKELQNKMSVIMSEQKELENAKSKVENEKKQLEEDKKKLNSLSSENQKIINELFEKQNNKEAEIADNESRQRELEQALEKYNAQKAAAAEKKKKSEASGSIKNENKKTEETKNDQKKENSESSSSENKNNNNNNNQNSGNNNESSQSSNNNNYDPDEDYYEEPVNPPAPDDKYVWPCPGHTYLTSEFEEWRGTYNHGALDIADGNVYGATVIACQAGTVFSTNTVCDHDYGKFESCGCGGGYGKYVMIDHGNGKISIYGHLSNVVVEPGQYVTKGQYIGNVGSTGYSTGPHLHFELRKDGVKYDPMSEY